VSCGIFNITIAAIAARMTTIADVTGLEDGGAAGDGVLAEGGALIVVATVFTRTCWAQMFRYFRLDLLS
jgi:hypothetical protein